MGIVFEKYHRLLVGSLSIAQRHRLASSPGFPKSANDLLAIAGTPSRAQMLAQTMLLKLVPHHFVVGDKPLR